MKMNLKSKKSITNIRDKVRGWRVNLAILLLPMVLVLLALALILVGVGNHALFYNTRYFESTELLYQVPDLYSLSDKKVEIDSTYYSIKSVVYVFRSVGTQFNTAEGILTQGYNLRMYPEAMLAVFVYLIYFISEWFKSKSYGRGITARVKENKWWGRGFILSFVMFVFLVLQLLFPLL